MRIIISKTVTRKLGKLVEVLLHEDYFATSATAYKYVDSIYDFIFSIEKQPARKTQIVEMEFSISFTKPMQEPPGTLHSTS